MRAMTWFLAGARNRKDKKIRRTLVSRIANRIISCVSGVHLHDYGCTLKAYRRDVLRDVRLYGEMHRFIPIYAHWQGARVTELPVHHHPRRFGTSKYGLERVLKVVLDLVVVTFLHRYLAKPIYVFGGFGLFLLGARGSLLRDHGVSTASLRHRHDTHPAADVDRNDPADWHHQYPHGAARRDVGAYLFRVAGPGVLLSTRYREYRAVSFSNVRHLRVCRRATNAKRLPQ